MNNENWNLNVTNDSISDSSVAANLELFASFDGLEAFRTAEGTFELESNLLGSFGLQVQI